MMGHLKTVGSRCPVLCSSWSGAWGGGEAGKGSDSVESFLTSLQRVGSVLGSSGCPRWRAGGFLFLGLSCKQPPVLRWRILLGPSEKMSILSKDARECAPEKQWALAKTVGREL